MLGDDPNFELSADLEDDVTGQRRTPIADGIPGRGNTPGRNTPLSP